ncbi:MAG: amidase [Chloroflexi bacterium]|nr:amidase [Chloroflexota bacterium]
MNNIITLSATQIAQEIKSGKVSAREVVDAHIDRIEAVNSRINAVVIPLFEDARKAAEAADTAQRRGDPLGPLHGVPITIKEQFLVKGTATTFGLPNQKNHRAAEDGPLVKRLREAGAIILGKTNVSQLLIYIEADNPVYGRTNNPWNLERTCGGSSGGEAAIIAAGGSPLGLGGDLGGSIREPAHFCGIHGLKPTSWRLTNFDTRSDVFAGGQEVIVPQPGPMARSVADLNLMLDVLAAPGGERIDPSTPPVSWRNPADVSVNALRIAVYTDDGYFKASPAIRRVVDEAADALRATGAQVEAWTPPNVSQAVRLFFSIFTSDAVTSLRRALGPDKAVPQISGILQSSGMPRPMRKLVAALMQSSGQERLASVLRAVGARSAEDFWKLVDERNQYRLRFIQSLDAGRFDAILCPPTSLPAVLHGSTADLLDFDSYARLYNVLGMPAGVVAAGRVREGEESDRQPSKNAAEQTALRVEKGSAGLPVGVQVVARHWREDVALAVMSALEKYFRTQPGYPSQPSL